MYVDFVRHVAPLTIALREWGTEAAGYHGKNLSTHDKKKILSRWRSNELQVVVSTKAFGMGINQPDVELVVHIGCHLPLKTGYRSLEGLEGMAGMLKVCVPC